MNWITDTAIFGLQDGPTNYLESKLANKDNQHVPSCDKIIFRQTELTARLAAVTNGALGVEPTSAKA